MPNRRALAILWTALILSLLSAGPAALTARPAALYALTQQWQRCPPWFCETGWYASPAVGDLNHDGQPDVVWGGYTLMAVNGVTGAIEWNLPKTNNRLWPGLVIADPLGNNTLQVV